MKSAFFVFVLIFGTAFCAPESWARTDTSSARSVAAAKSKPSDESVKKSLNYRLRAGDMVEMRVYQEDYMRTIVRVNPDGKVVLPLLGPTVIGGLTLEEIEGVVAKRYVEEDIFVDPQVSFQILRYTERRIMVLGEVNTPGTYVIPPEETITLSDAISMANGLNRLAEPHKIRVTRTLPNGKKKTEVYDWEKILKRPDMEDVKLKDGDVVLVIEKHI